MQNIKTIHERIIDSKISSSTTQMRGQDTYQAVLSSWRHQPSRSQFSTKCYQKALNLSSWTVSSSGSRQEWPTSRSQQPCKNARQMMVIFLLATQISYGQKSMLRICRHLITLWTATLILSRVLKIGQIVTRQRLRCWKTTRRKMMKKRDSKIVLVI